MKKKRNTMALKIIALACVVLFSVALIAVAVSIKNAPPAAKWNPTKAEVASRERTIQRLQADDIFGDIDVSNNVGHIVVRPAFYFLEFKDKQSSAAAAMGWCLDHDPSCDFMVLRDSLTDKKVGTYSRSWGGLELE